MIWVAIMVYSMACTLLVIRRMGFRFLWATLYRVKQHATAPQGLVLTGTVLMLSLLTWTYTISSILAPGYTHFGNQVYCNHTQGGQRNCTERIDKIFPCDIWAPIEICTPTVTSTLIDRMLLNSPFLASLFYYGQWLFMLSFLLGCLMALSKSDLQSEEVEERQPLLVQA
ncbi:hypothetical protein BY458DRAFT_432763 [Sporodiniella umbellata]|nr:hypothetical protein BY458DRAFT_432763 [Sporodiniella umbellata]